MSNQQSAISSHRTARFQRIRRLPIADGRLLVFSCWLLVAGVTGCESLQRKFTRKPTRPAARPTPIIQFEDYTRTMTPLDRYRKHYLMFDYWNEELMQALQSHTPNPKRFKRASTESLEELKTMQSLVTEDLSARFVPVLDVRTKIDRELQSASFSASQMNPLWRSLEAQTRQIHREFFWRDVEEQLK